MTWARAAAIALSATMTEYNYAPGGFDDLIFPSSGGGFSRHRPSGCRAHRKWKRNRASGISKPKAR